MSARKAKMFNKKAAKPVSKANDILRKMAIKQGYWIADIGAGGGYFALKFAQKVGSKGRVYCVDIDNAFLDFIDTEVEKAKIKNIMTIHSRDMYIDLPDKKLDYIFMRNVYHHLKNRVLYFKKLKKYLKVKSGRIIIVEHRPGIGLSFHKMFGHSVDSSIIVEEMMEAGYELHDSYDILPEQSFTVYKIKI